MKINLNSKDKFSLYFLLSITILVIILTPIVNSYQKCKLSNKYRVTITTPYKYFYGKADYFIYSSFIIKDKKISKLIKFKGLKPSIGNRYILLYNEDDIESSIILSNIIIPDSIKTAPNGWAKIPIPAYQKEVDEFFEGACDNIFTKNMFMDDEN